MAVDAKWSKSNIESLYRTPSGISRCVHRRIESADVDAITTPNGDDSIDPVALSRVPTIAVANSDQCDQLLRPAVAAARTLPEFLALRLQLLLYESPMFFDVVQIAYLRILTWVLLSFLLWPTRNHTDSSASKRRDQ